MKSMKNYFPIFKNYPNLVYLDSAATTQKPQVFLDALNEFYQFYNANVHRGVHLLGNKATVALEESKDNIAQFINASPKNILFFSGATDAINYASSLIKNHLFEGDEIMVSQLEHHANFIPWQQLCIEKKLKLKVIEVNSLGVLNEGDILNSLTHKTKLIAITHLSNVTGQLIDVKKIINFAHKKGVKVLIDGAQAVSKIKIDLKELNADFYVFSAHKLYSSNGLGILYINDDFLNKPPVRFGGGTVENVIHEKTIWINGAEGHQPGTPALGEIFAFSKTLKWLSHQDYIQHDQEIYQATLNMLKNFSEIKIVGKADSGAISFMVEGINPQDINAILDQQNIAIRTGSHCALPFMHKMHFSSGTSRISFGLYNEPEDIKKLKQALEKAIRIFK